MGDRPEGVRPVPDESWRWFERWSAAVVPTAAVRARPTPAAPATKPSRPRPTPITIDSRQFLLGAAGLAWLQRSAQQFRELAATAIHEDFEAQLRHHPQDAATILEGTMTRLGLRLLAQGLPRPHDIALRGGQYHVRFPSGGLAIGIGDLPEIFVTTFIPGRYGFRGALDLDREVTFGVRITRRGPTALAIDITNIDGIALRAWDASNTLFLYDVHIDIERGQPCVRVHYEPATVFPEHCWEATDDWRLSTRELAGATRMIATAQRVLETATDIFTGEWLSRMAPAVPVLP